MAIGIYFASLNYTNIKMKVAFVVAAIMGLAMALPQAVTDTIEPSGNTLGSCSRSYPGSFQIAVVSMEKLNKRDIADMQVRYPV